MGLSLLLVVHGRQGGEIPGALQDLAAELQERRGAPVRMQALTGEPPPVDGLRPACSSGVLLVPLLLLPGSHARVDVPAIARYWRASGPLRRLPFLGAWPVWQQGLAEELAAMGGSETPVLLHHPLEGKLAARYLQLLEQRCRCRCIATPYSAADSADTTLPASHAGSGAVLPLALAANRLCERLQLAPLLERPRLRQLLVRELEALP